MHVEVLSRCMGLVNWVLVCHRGLFVLKLYRFTVHRTHLPCPAQGVYSKPDSEFSENQQREKRVECNTLIIFTYYITSPPQGSRPGEKGRDLQGAALQRPCAAHDRLRPLTRLSRAAAGRQVLAQVVLPAPVQPPGERRQHDERTGHHHHREIGADHRSEEHTSELQS